MTTTATAHSLTRGRMTSPVKPAMAKTATLTTAAVRLQRMVMSASFLQWLMRLHRTYRSRQQLAELSQHLLADIGLSEAQRQAELRKPFWKSQGPQ